MKKEQLTKFNRGQASKIFRQIISSGDPLVVMQHDKAMVVIIPADKYIELTKTPIKIEVEVASNKRDEK